MLPLPENRAEGELDLDKAVKLIGEEAVKQVAGEDWKDGTWKGLDPVDEELQVTDNIENNQGKNHFFGLCTLNLYTSIVSWLIIW